MDIKYVLLDICDTLVNFQTADKFVEFVLEKKNLHFKNVKLNLLKLVRNTYIGKIFYRRGLNYKLRTLKFIKGLKYEELDYFAFLYYKNIIKHRYNPFVLKFLGKYKSAKVFIVSGGYDIYIKYIAKDLGIKHIVCSELHFDKNIFTGKLKDLDCMGINKVILLDKKNLLKEIDFETTAVLSDSISDLPLFSLGKYKIAVNPDRELSKLIGKGWFKIEDLIV